MQRLGHQFLAHAGFALDQHAQVAGAHQRDFLEQRTVGSALADQALAGRLGGQPVALHAGGELADALGRGHGGGGQGRQRVQQLQVHLIEALRLQRIQRQQAPGPAVAVGQVQRTAQTVVHRQVALHAVHQAVVGVGEVAVGRKAQRAGRFQQLAKARVVGHAKAPAQRVSAQSIGGHGPQHLAFQPQQGRGVAGQHAAQALQQPAKALGLGQVTRQVGHQGHDGIQPLGRRHFDLLLSD